MCGIVGAVGTGEETLDRLLASLSVLEYRGYDSAGVALANGDLAVAKRAGTLDALEAALETADPRPAGPLGIGHTRWSTHGPPTDANAHPHTDGDGRVAVVHNGIVENHGRLRERLRERGVEFASETDTEVIPHLIARELDAGADPETAFRAAVDALSGSYAVAAVIAGEPSIFATRKDSPLVLGLGDGANYLASDVPALVAYTDRVVHLDDGDVVALDPDGWSGVDAAGAPLDHEPRTVDIDPEQTGKGGYEHFMLKEIHEQPTALRQCLSGRVDEIEGTVALPELDSFPPFRRVQLVAAGTSYHAALFGARLFATAGVPAHASLANEYGASPPPVPEDTLVIGVTQSGETADTLAALRAARARGGRTLALTNVVESTAARECDHAVYVRAGPEIGVAATKTFASQLVAINLLVEDLAGAIPGSRRAAALVTALRDLPGAVQAVLDRSTAAAVVDEYVGSDAYFFVGRGLDHPVALEGALKFKEITYEHAEGFAAGELKHGPLALVEGSTPVFAVVTGDGEPARKAVGNVREVEARGAPVVVVGDPDTEAADHADHVLPVPDTHPRLAPLLANVHLQLVAYHTADRLGREIDKPRNLAKSVTVE